MKYLYFIIALVVLAIIIWVFNPMSQNTPGTQEAPHSLQTAPAN